MALITHGTRHKVRLDTIKSDLRSADVELEVELQVSSILAKPKTPVAGASEPALERRARRVACDALGITTAATTAATPSNLACREEAATKVQASWRGRQARTLRRRSGARGRSTPRQ